MNIRGLFTSAAAVATVAAAALAAPAAAAPVMTGGAGSTAAAAGRLPHAAFAANLHARFGKHAAMDPRAGIMAPRGSGRAATRASGGSAVKPAAPQACTEPDCNLKHNGGPVQHSPRVYVVFWGPTWHGSGQTSQAAVVESYLTSFYGGLGASGDTWSKTTSQYTDGSGRPVFTKSVFVTDGFDTSAPPGEVSPSDLANEAAAAATRFGIKDLANAQVVVASQTGTCFTDGFAGSSCTPVPAQYCAWHSATPFGNGLLSFTNLPYQLDAGISCGQDFIDSDLDGFSIVGGHEYAEAVTDPDPDSGWIDEADGVSGGEIADKCAWEGQLWNQSPPDPAGDVTLATGTFAMQSLWSNASGSCVMTVGPLPFSVTKLANQASAIGHAVSVQVHAATTPRTPLIYTASGLPSGLSINRSTGLIHGTVGGAVKVYKPKVTAGYYDGSSSFTFNWTIDAVGQVKGSRAKCVDNAGGKAKAGNKIDLLTCNGKIQQKLTYTPAGQLQVQGGCVTGGKLAFFEPCSATASKTWTRVGSEYRNKATGNCLTDPNNSNVNGTWLSVTTCSNKVNQRWSLP